MVKKKEEEAIEAEIVAEETSNNPSKNNIKRADGRIFWGLLLILLGILFLLQNYFSIDVWGVFWPVILVFIGLFLILKSSRR